MEGTAVVGKNCMEDKDVSRTSWELAAKSYIEQHTVN